MALVYDEIGAAAAGRSYKTEGSSGLGLGSFLPAELWIEESESQSRSVRYRSGSLAQPLPPPPRPPRPMGRTPRGRPMTLTGSFNSCAAWVRSAAWQQGTSEVEQLH